MKNLIIGLEARIKAVCPSIKTVGTWNNQVQDMTNADGAKTYTFACPAVFFEFVNENPVEHVGNGVQVFDPMDIRAHIIHDYYNADIGLMEENHVVYDIEQEVHNGLQLYAVKGADYGSSALSRVSVEQDYDHSNVYHKIPTYRTTWTDNSRAWPIGGNTHGPSLLTEITPDIL